MNKHICLSCLWDDTLFKIKLLSSNEWYGPWLGFMNSAGLVEVPQKLFVFNRNDDIHSSIKSSVKKKNICSDAEII